MNIIRRAVPVICFAVCMFSVNPAFALSVDDTTMAAPGKAEHFSDPDEKMPTLNMNAAGKERMDVQDPSTVRYDYDPANGTYVPHNQANDGK